MVIKLKYNIIASILGVVVVLVFCIFELFTPHSINVQTNTEQDSVALPVVMYHHLSTNSNKFGDYVISVKQFEKDLQYIQKCGYQTITSTQLIAFLEDGEPLPEKPILITFDDGFESVYRYGFPILEEYGMHAVTSVIGKHTDIFSNPDEPRHIDYAHASWEQLNEMQDSGVFEIQNHSYDMHANTNGSRYGIRIKYGESLEDYRDALFKDVGGLSSKIEEHIGIASTVFAYPFGALCKESKPILEELGFKIYLTCEEKVNILEPYTPGLVAIRRFNRAYHYDTKEFFKRLGVE